VTVPADGRVMKPDHVRSLRPGLRTPQAMLVFFLLGMNLRVGVGGIPPLLAPIAADVHLSGAGQGMLTSVAILTMAMFAPSGPVLARRFGH
jgi:CP family cyanate transporter-like MFS transporter